MMSVPRLEAIVETRIFYFTVINKKESELALDMYNTPYVLVKAGETWNNHNSNKMIMSPELINAVIAASYEG